MANERIPKSRQSSGEVRVKTFEDVNSNHQELIESFKNTLDTSLIQKAEIKNIVACSSTKYELDLSKLYANLLINTDYEVWYEPKVFSGLCIKTDIGSSNIYPYGKYLLLGATDLNGLEKLNKLIINLIT